MAIEVQTEVFEGPFDLLLHLILRDRVELYEISLTRIVDAYLQHLDEMARAAARLDLDVATEFLLIAATLVDLKARRLLPEDADLDLDEELGIWEERDLLLARLLECKTFKDAAVRLRRLHDAGAECFPRVTGPDERFVDLTPDALEGVTADQVAAAFRRAITPQPRPRVDLFHVAPIRASVVDAVAELIEELPGSGRVTFRSLTASLVDAIEIAVRFLAVLELFKQGLIDVDQAGTFGEIGIVWTGGDVDEAAATRLVDAYDG
ncbi:MAG: segregation/condensation protein A [Microthrixaceae bacterium]